ncbi:MAG: ABC transporter ATP-binding protein [Bowdeniella nasicola]|nr:ABC transporter ATP-binding protein [Bowdeniella nasicola]
MDVTTPVITMSDVTKRFGTLTAVDRVSFHVNAGEILALLGPNGAGKSTLFSLMSGLDRPDHGRVQLFGKTPAAAVATGSFSVMLQSGALLEEEKVGRLLHLFSHLAVRAANIDDIIARCDISHLLHRPVGKCSGGELQRVRLAIALLSDPQLLILDEPTAGMDPSARRHFWQIMQQEADAGRTIIFATHYLEEASRYAPRTVIMAAGRIVADGPTSTVRSMAARHHLTARIPSAAWQELAGELQPLRDVQVDYHDESLTLIGPDLRTAAIAVLSCQAASDIELTHASLDDTFEHLTAKGKAR